MKPNENPTGDKLLRKRDAAKLLACCCRTIERMAADGQLLSVRVRGAVRYRLSEVMAIVERGGV